MGRGVSAVSPARRRERLLQTKPRPGSGSHSNSGQLQVGNSDTPHPGCQEDWCLGLEPAELHGGGTMLG